MIILKSFCFCIFMICLIYYCNCGGFRELVASCSDLVRVTLFSCIDDNQLNRNKTSSHTWRRSHSTTCLLRRRTSNLLKQSQSYLTKCIRIESASNKHLPMLSLSRSFLNKSQVADMIPSASQ